ncbi:MAG: Hsp70 family protein, partial [Cohaesibacteraceae bacterium]|nr:Hsp70 family protein [Cohaesibacteraceae bacterium]MBL4876173.1 Hsp70 family protein [Cohaesibacteraceae bacterium]
MKSSNCCGLDFGTSNSTIGLGLSSGAALCPVEGTNVTIPSAIFFDFEDNKTLFGRAGIASYMEEIDGRLMRSLKSILGTSTMQEKTRVGKGTKPFTQILGKFVRHLKQCAETHLGSDINSVVLGRPVHFIDYDEKADKIAEETLAQIARDQGFRHVDFQFEPIAAALDYEQSVEQEELALIADIGGGTSDFTIVRLSPDRALKLDRADDILANEGVHIGGTDFDRRLSLKQIM